MTKEQLHLRCLAASGARAISLPESADYATRAIQIPHVRVRAVTAKANGIEPHATRLEHFEAMLPWNVKPSSAQADSIGTRWHHTEINGGRGKMDTVGLLSATHLNSEPSNAGQMSAISSTPRRDSDDSDRIAFAPCTDPCQ